MLAFGLIERAREADVAIGSCSLDGGQKRTASTSSAIRSGGNLE